MNNEKLSEGMLFMGTGRRETMDEAASAGRGMSITHTAASKIIYYTLMLNSGYSDAPEPLVQGMYGKPSGNVQGKACSRNGEKTGRKYRTKKTAGQRAEVPAYLPVITNKTYRDAITFNCNGSAYLQLLSDGSELKYKNGSSYFKGLAANCEKIKGLFTNDGIKEVHIPLLMALYGIFLQKASSSSGKAQGLDEKIVFYYPEFAKKLGKTHTGVKDIEAFASAMEQLTKIVGIVHNGQSSSDILPVLSGYEHDKDTNTIHIASPYITRIIKEIHNASIRKDKNGEPVKNKNGEFRTLPAYSYLVDISIEKERNRKAVEIVMIIVALIEQSGKHTPHIRARTVIERSSLLKGSMKGPSTQKKDTVLQRSFSKAWELLQTKTKLSTVYRDIKLPDPENPCYIPTCPNLDMVFTFPHKGKCTDS